MNRSHTSVGSHDLLEDLRPVDVTMFGVGDNPVEAERDSHLGNAGRLQRDPKTIDGLVSRKFPTELLDGLSFHSNG